MARQNLGEKFTIKGVILLILLIALLIGLFWLIVFSGEPKTPPTSQQVATTLEKYGLPAQDFSNEYIEAYPKRSFVSVVGYRTKDFRIEWFEFEGEKGARAATVDFNQAILDARDITNDIEFEEANPYYYIHTYNVGDKHFWVMRIENTAIYGFCYDDNYEKMVDVMTELGYTSK